MAPITWLSLSQGFSLVAGNMGNVTMGWWAAKQGGLVDLSILGSSYLIFVLFLGPMLSPVGDRVSRINLYGVALLSGLMYYLVWAFGLFGSGYGRWLIVLMAFINAITMSLVGPIRMAIFIDAKGDNDSAKVVTAQRFFDTVGRCLGPIVAGVVCAQWGYAAAFFVQVIFFIGAVATYVVCRRGFSSAIHPRQGKAGLRQWGRDIALGFELRLASPGQRIFTAITLLFTAATSACISVILPHVVSAGGYASALLGLSVSASFLGGLAVGAVFLSSRFPRGKSLVPLAISVGSASMLFIAHTSRKEWIVVGAFLIGCCGEIYLQQVGLRLILSYPTQVRARVAAAGQFIIVASVAVWCWLLVLLHAHWGVSGATIVMVVSGLLAAALSLHPAVDGFLRCPNESLEGFWNRAMKPAEPAAA